MNLRKSGVSLMSMSHNSESQYTYETLAMCVYKRASLLHNPITTNITQTH